jgi:hypothetical protein
MEGGQMIGLTNTQKGEYKHILLSSSRNSCVLIYNKAALPHSPGTPQYQDDTNYAGNFLQTGRFQFHDNVHKKHARWTARNVPSGPTESGGRLCFFLKDSLFWKLRHVPL